MSLTITSWINGISAIINFAIALFIAIFFIIRFSKTKKNLQPWVALFGFVIAASYVGPSLTFFKLAITGENITPDALYYIAYWSIPGQTLSMMWIGFTVFAEEQRKPVMLFYCLTAIVYYIFFLFLKDMSLEIGGGTTTWEEFNAAGDLLDISLKGFLRYLIAFWIGSIVVTFVVGFSRLWTKLEKDNPYKKKIVIQMIAWVLYIIGGVIEVLAPVEVAVIGRISLMICLVLLFISFKD